MSLKKFFISFLILIVCPVKIKSDISQIPKNDRSLDPLSQLMQENNYRQHVIQEQTAMQANLEDQTARDQRIMTELSRAVVARLQQVKNIKEQSKEEQLKQKRLEQELSSTVTRMEELIASGSATYDDRAQYRTRFIQRLRALNEHLEFVITRHVQRERIEQQRIRELRIRERLELAAKENLRVLHESRMMKELTNRNVVQKQSGQCFSGCGFSRVLGFGRARGQG